MILGLRDGRLDLALIGVGGASPPGLTTRVLLDETLVAAVRRDDPLATADGDAHEAELHVVTIAQPVLRARIELA